MTNAPASSYDLSSSMVSRVPEDRSLAVRRPPSVSSRSTTTRRHRSHRSHHGGSSYLPQNEFPNFSLTGDVEIVVNADGQEKRYTLHRLILSQCSGFFEASTSEQWSRAQAQAQAQNQPRNGERGNERGLGLAAIGEESEGSQLQRLEHSRTNSSSSTAGPKPMWRYELDWGPDGQDEVPMLVQKPPTTSIFGGDQTPRPPPPPSSKPTSSSNGLFRSLSAMQSAVHIPKQAAQPQAESDTIRDYDNLFRIFYNYPPNLDAVNITEAYIQCKTLITLADMYDALDVVGPRIDHHLLQFQSRLWKQIAKYPPSYLKLGYMSRSKSIFAEALIHVVGQWPQGASQLRGMPDTVIELIEDKVADLDDLKARIEARLFRLTLTTSRGERVSPQNNYLDWSVVSLFRHWLAESTMPPPPTPAKTNPLTSPTGANATARAGGMIPPPPMGSNAHHSQAHNTTITLQTPSQPPSYNSSGGGGDLPSLTPSTSGRIFRLLGASGPAYLPREELKKFLKSTQPDHYSRDGLRRFERKMEELKNLARETVRPLMRNGLELDLGGGVGLGYLTCTRVLEEDYPW